MPLIDPKDYGTITDINGGEEGPIVISDDGEVIGFNEGGFNWVGIDLLGILNWCDKNPDFVKRLRDAAKETT